MTVSERLYSLADEYRQLEATADEFDPNDPVQAETFMARLDAVGDRLSQKVEQVVALMRDLQHAARKRGDEAKSFEDEAAFHRLAEKRLLARAAWFESYVLREMEVAGIPAVLTDRFTVRVQQNPPHTDVVDEKLVPAGFLRRIEEVVVPAHWEVNKAAINKNFLATGEIPPGVEVSRGTKLVVS